MKIVNLKECKYLIPIIANGLFYEWPAMYLKILRIESSLKLEQYLLRTFMNKHHIPTAYVAIDTINGKETFIGFLSIQYNGYFDKDEYIKNIPWLSQIYVEPSYRNQGIAQALIKHSMAFLKSLGAINVFLWIDDPKMVYFYARYGFSPFKEVTFKDTNFIMMKAYANTPPPLLEPVHYIGMIVLILLVGCAYMFWDMLKPRR